MNDEHPEIAALDRVEKSFREAADRSVRKVEELRKHFDEERLRAEEREETRLEKLEDRWSERDKELRGDFSRLSERVSEALANKEVIARTLAVLTKIVKAMEDLGSVKEKVATHDWLLKFLLLAITLAALAQGLARIYFTKP